MHGAGTPTDTTLLIGPLLTPRSAQWHADSTCEQYKQWKLENSEADQRFHTWAEANTKKCPKCPAKIEKDGTLLPVRRGVADGRIIRGLQSHDVRLVLARVLLAVHERLHRRPLLRRRMRAVHLGELEYCCTIM